MEGGYGTFKRDEKTYLSPIRFELVEDESIHRKDITSLTKAVLPYDLFIESKQIKFFLYEDFPKRKKQKNINLGKVHSSLQDIRRRSTGEPGEIIKYTETAVLKRGNHHGRKS